MALNENEMKKLEKLNARYKKQNDLIKDGYDRISVIIPKGTKERIKAQGESINSFVNRLVLAELERLERQKIQERDIRHPDFYSNNDDLPDLPFS